MLVVLQRPTNKFYRLDVNSGDVSQLGEITPSINALAADDKTIYVPTGRNPGVMGTKQNHGF
jgi:hypothetical protein